MRMVFPPHVTGRFINDLTSDMNAFVESLFGEEADTESSRANDFTPRMDVYETEKAYQLSFDLPGVNPDEIEIQLEEESLTIRGHRKHEVAENVDETRRRVERVFGNFRRTVPLPKTVDQDAVEADYTDGVLTVTVPKAVPAEARKVTIQRGQKTEIASAADQSSDAAAKGE